MKVVFHIQDRDMWSMTLGNVANLIRASVGEEIVIEVVANANAVTGYVGEEYEEPIRELWDKGVTFSSCRNAMNAHQIQGEALLDAVQVVPAGVYQLVTLQEAGYAYIKVS